MADPVGATKTTALAILSSLIGAAAAEYSIMLAASLVGGFVGLSLLRKPLAGWWRPLAHVLTGSGLALLVTPLGAAVAVQMLPAAWSITLDLVLPVVALAIAVWWHPALNEWGPAVVRRWIGSRPEGQ